MASFFQALDTLRVKRAHHYPRASDHVNDMVERSFQEPAKPKQ